MEQKVLIMGRANAGKSSMRSVIFAGHDPMETTYLPATQDIDSSSVTLLGELKLALWDCGGQDIYRDSYLDINRDLVFSNVACLIFVLECKQGLSNRTSIGEAIAADLEYLHRSVAMLKEKSPNAKLFVLLHKMDLIQPELRSDVLPFYTDCIEDRLREFALPDRIIWPTSIWNETLYLAFSVVLRALIPQVKRLENKLAKLASVLHADDLILLEKNTFLTVAHAKPHVAVGSKPNTPSSEFAPQSLEGLSNVIKNFKLSCQRSGNDFHTIQVNLADSSLLIERFTSNLFIVISLPARDANLGAVMLNVDLAAPLFEEFERKPKEPDTIKGPVDTQKDVDTIDAKDAIDQEKRVDTIEA